MNIAETAKVLAKIQLGDNRVVSDLVVQEWHDVIGFLRFDDAVEAVRRHRRESAEYLLPAHVVAGARAIARVRAAQGLPEAFVTRDRVPAPKPSNFEALVAAKRSGDAGRIAEERAEYNRQLVEAGFDPVSEWGLV